MVRRYLFTCIAVAALFVLPQTVSTANGQTPLFPAPINAPIQAAHREAIRQMPILNRPSRPGHFYGNTVRRRHAMRTGRGN